jgi:hypothetical protein
VLILVAVVGAVRRVCVQSQRASHCMVSASNLLPSQQGARRSVVCHRSC